jgi:hypothetical protein
VIRPARATPDGFLTARAIETARIGGALIFARQWNGLAEASAHDAKRQKRQRQPNRVSILDGHPLPVYASLSACLDSGCVIQVHVKLRETIVMSAVR